MPKETFNPTAAWGRARDHWDHHDGPMIEEALLIGNDSGVVDVGDILPLMRRIACDYFAHGAKHQSEGRI